MENREAVKQTLNRVFVMLQQLEMPPTERNVSLMNEVYKGLRDVFGTINATEVETDEGNKTAD